MRVDVYYNIFRAPSIPHLNGFLVKIGAEIDKKFVINCYMAIWLLKVRVGPKGEGGDAFLY